MSTPKFVQLMSHSPGLGFGGTCRLSNGIEASQRFCTTGLYALGDDGRCYAYADDFLHDRYVWIPLGGEGKK